MTVTSEPASPRDAAREWIAQTLRTHLHPSLHPIGGEDRITEVATLVEAEAYREGWPVETAVDMAVEWCEIQNDEANLHAGQN